MFYNIILSMHAICMALLPSINDPQDILADIVSQGYDTDTVAAIAGSILGARFGYLWIPTNRLMDLERLQQYCEILVHRNKEPKIESRDKFMEVEAHWTKTEKDYQRTLIATYGQSTPSKKSKTRDRQKRN